MSGSSTPHDEQYMAVCPECGGDGEFEDPYGPTEQCRFCNGTGEIETEPAGEEMFDE